MQTDEELKMQTSQMTEFAKRASEQWGPIIFTAALREYRATITSLVLVTPSKKVLDVADTLMTQIEQTPGVDEDSKEFIRP